MLFQFPAACGIRCWILRKPRYPPGLCRSEEKKISLIRTNQKVGSNAKSNRLNSDSNRRDPPLQIEQRARGVAETRVRDRAALPNYFHRIVKKVSPPLSSTGAYFLPPHHTSKVIRLYLVSLICICTLKVESNHVAGFVQIPGICLGLGR